MRLVNPTCTVLSAQAQRFPEEELELHRRTASKLILRELQIAMTTGAWQFRVGMSMGADIWTAEQVLRLREHDCACVQLHCYLPYEGQANYWPEHWRERYFNILSQADEVYTLQGRHSFGCVARRNFEMLCGAGRLIAVHDKIADGTIDRAVSYAESRGIEAVVIQLAEGPPALASVYDDSSKRFRLSSTKADKSSTGKSANKEASETKSSACLAARGLSPT